MLNLSDWGGCRERARRIAVQHAPKIARADDSTWTRPPKCITMCPGLPSRGPEVVTTHGSSGPEFERFFVANRQRLVRAAVAWTGDRALADEITHEVMLAVRRCWGRHERPEMLMFRITREVLHRIEEASQATPLNTRVIGPAREEPAAVGSGRGTAPSRDQLNLMRALRRLPLRQREAITFTVVCDLDQVSAAEILGISVNALAGHRERGLAVLASSANDPLASTGLGPELTVGGSAE